MRNDFVLMSLISAEEHILQIFLTQDKIPTGINIFCPLDKWFPQLVYESKLRRFVRWIDMGDTYIKPKNNVWNWKTWNIGGFLVEYVENFKFDSSFWKVWQLTGVGQLLSGWKNKSNAWACSKNLTSVLRE